MIDVRAISGVSVITSQQPFSGHISDGKWTAEDTGIGIALDFGGEASAQPGFINGHDHLDFNLYPSLKSRLYEDYIDWQEDLHQQFGSQIRRILNIPQNHRYAFGALKNLLCGVTTVIHHGYYQPTALPGIRLWSKYLYVHATGLSWRWKYRLMLMPKGNPLMIHIGEGTTRRVQKEYSKLQQWNLKKHPVWAVHGMALPTRAFDQLAGLAWCPGSNVFLYGSTLDPSQLLGRIPVILGSDSSLTGSWNWFDHLKEARRHSDLTPMQLFDMVTRSPESGLSGFPFLGDFGADQEADMVVWPERLSPEGVLNERPENILAVIQKGKLVVFDEALLSQIAPEHRDHYVAVLLNGRRKYVPGYYAACLQIAEGLKDMVPHLPSLLPS